ncbi:MAG: putative addiction module antidote protein, partial [Methylobacteriaceae bacterium]
MRRGQGEPEARHFPSEDLGDDAGRNGMMTETSPYDSAEFLESDEAVAEYLAAAIE